MEKDEDIPSEIEEEGREWLLYGIENSEEKLEDYLKKNEVRTPENLEEDDLPERENPKVKKIDRRASKDGYLSGKWEFNVPPKRVDEVWIEIKRLISQGEIWSGQVTTNWIREKRGLDDHMIRVYTPNYLDKEDVLRVGNLIKERCKIEEELCYKPDIYNILQIYSEEGEERKLPEEIRYRI